MQRRGHFTIIGHASVGVVHIDFIEHIIECVSIVHLGVQTAREQAAHTKPGLETPCRSALRAVGLLMPRDRNWTAIHWNIKGKELQSLQLRCRTKPDELET